MSSPLRTTLVAGNWKMNTTRDEAIALARGVVQATTHANADVLIVPPTCFLGEVARVVEGSHVALGAQNIHPGDYGARTGEVSGPMLTSLGVSYALCGHSERRHIFGESAEWVGEKVQACHTHNIVPILCVGESLEQREANQTEAIIEDQLTQGLHGLHGDQVARTVIAYEPVWAIGTGRTASPEQAQNVHAFIRGWLTDQHGEAVAQMIRIQYGGSVKPQNAAALLAGMDVDGALVGGAALSADSFAAIASV
jgi:triosephosphate isomerase